MRVAAAAELLSQTPVFVVATLAEWIERVGRDPGGAEAVALDAMCVALTEPDWLSYEHRAEIYSAARAQEHPVIPLLFFEATADAEVAKLREKASNERPLSPNAKPLSLGERKSLARGNDRQLLGKLLRDPHAAVIEILLGNPHLTESDALIVASNRPSLPESLEAVYLSERFRTRHKIRRALALNPYTPLPIAARTTLSLRAKDLRDLCDDRSISAPLRLHARSLLGIWGIEYGS